MIKSTYQVYVISGDRKTFVNIGGQIRAASERAAIAEQKKRNSAPAKMGRVAWRAQKIK